MLRPSRDWRESITLSSRDPHFGQRIVSEDSVSHNNLWRQRAKTTIAQFRFRGRRTSLHSARTRPANRRVLRKTGRRPVLPCSVASISNTTRPKSCARGTRFSYAAAALGAAIFFFGFVFFSSNWKPTFPFSNFRYAEKARPFLEINLCKRSVFPVVISFCTCSFGISRCNMFLLMRKLQVLGVAMAFSQAQERSRT